MELKERTSAGSEATLPSGSMENKLSRAPVFTARNRFLALLLDNTPILAGLARSIVAETLKGAVSPACFRADRFSAKGPTKDSNEVTVFSPTGRKTAIPAKKQRHCCRKDLSFQKPQELA